MEGRTFAAAGSVGVNDSAAARHVPDFIQISSEVLPATGPADASLELSLSLAA